VTRLALFGSIARDKGFDPNPFRMMINFFENSIIYIGGKFLWHNLTPRIVNGLDKEVKSYSDWRTMSIIAPIKWRNSQFVRQIGQKVSFLLHIFFTQGSLTDKSVISKADSMNFLSKIAKDSEPPCDVAR
jgi:hypothetical protein